MKAMIMAAGLGTRLKPITDKIPKALVEIEGTPILAHCILNLKSQGFDEIVINVHHFANQIIDYLSQNDFGVDIKISDESDQLLDTAGGIIKASPLLFEKNHQPVLFYNVDILGNPDLKSLMEQGRKGAALLVSNRESSRKLIFDEKMKLKGWHNLKDEVFRPENLCIEPSDQELAFSGIYVLTRDNITEMERLLGRGKNSVIEYFLHPERKSPIKGVIQPDLKITDIGKLETLQKFRNEP